MAETNWIRHSVHSGIVGVRRTLRSFRQQRARVRLLVFTLINLALLFGGMGTLFALALRSQPNPIPVPGQVRIAVILLWLFGVWFFAKRVFLYRRRLACEAVVLTTVSPRTAALGLLITEFLIACLALAFPTPFLIGVIGYAFLEPASVVLLPLAIGLFAASAIVVGYIVGFGYLLLAARSHAIARNQDNLAHLVMLLLAGYVTVQVLFSVPGLTDLTTVTWVPISWLVDLSMLGTPVSVSIGRAVAGFIGSLGVITVGGGAAVTLATTYWETDRGVTLHDEETSSRASEESMLAAAISPLVIPSTVGTPTRRVAQVVLLRLRRAPRRLLFLVTTIISLGLSIGFIAVRMDNPLALVSVVCAVCFPWFAGAAFGLNPLGDEGVVLPATLTASVTGRQFIRGLMLPGLLYGLPLTVTTTLLTSVFSPYSLIERVGLLVLGVVLTVVAVVCAPAIGMRFPHFSAISIGREVVPPSLTAVSTYLCLAGSLSGVAVLLLLAVPLGRNGLLIWGDFAGWLIILLGFSYWLYRDTADRFATYTVE